MMASIPCTAAASPATVVTHGMPRRTAALAVLALLLLSSPWYVRSFVLAQDPVEPLLNLRLHGVDPKLSGDDLSAQVADLRTDTRVGAPELVRFAAAEEARVISAEHVARSALRLVRHW